jgi:GNAT superfamily N-acetyltransferase
MVPPESDPRRPGTFWVFNLDWPAPAGLAPLVPAAFERLGLESAGPLSRAMGHAAPEAVRARFAAGRRCYAALVREELAAYGWVSFDEEEIGEMRLRLRLAPGEAYIWDCATAPPFRRRRLYTALLAHITRELRAEGLCRVWIGADQDNVASQRGMARAGFKPVADIVVARALAMRLVWVRGRPGVPEPLVSDARRVLLGDRDLAWRAALSALQRGSGDAVV